jgi:hypothetical protein
MEQIGPLSRTDRCILDISIVRRHADSVSLQFFRSIPSKSGVVFYTYFAS